MDFSPVPKYPMFQSSAAPRHATGAWLSARERRLFSDLCFVAAFVVLLSCLRWMVTTSNHPRPPKSAPSPLDFKVVRERYKDVRDRATRLEVLGVLGPPTQRNVWVAQSVQWEEMHWRKDDSPYVRIWDKWTDPNDPDSWVLIMFGDAQVWAKYQQGF
jgi:hypothetical protein